MSNARHSGPSSPSRLSTARATVRVRSSSVLADLTFLVMSINAWNRVNVAFRTVPGSADEKFGLDDAKLT